MADDNKITYFLAGLGVGALIGILFAPRSGDETREYLSAKANEGRDFATKKGRELRDQADEYISKGKEVLDRQKENLREAVEVGKQAYRDVAGRRETTSEL